MVRSLFELADVEAGESLTLHFGPAAPDGAEDPRIKTIPDKGWFVYFRIYGPGDDAFDGSWQLPDIRT